MREKTTYEEKLVGGVPVIQSIKDTIVTYESLKAEAELRMPLDPAIQPRKLAQQIYTIRRNDSRRT